ncbi:MAG: NAD-dependent epimerase/dehydratase family protein [Chloroflexi bacterium]|nr:NAD-dependent epimerase/dehydratase family protein [Chloroflexota bacterium]
MDVLVIGGTRNIGHFLVHDLVKAGHRVTVVNRGIDRDELPAEVERLRADRTDRAQLEKVLSGRRFDAAVDNVLYRGAEAEAIIDLLEDRIGHYIFLSTGQVYLVREGLERPFYEDDYEGRLIPAPKLNTYSYEEWLYGMDKRQVEDVLAQAGATRNFPYTAIRIPMVNSERDHFKRLYGYMLRLRDGGPILVPETPDYPLRHVYAGDVVKAIRQVIETGKGKGRSYNISQDETTTLQGFLELLGGMMGIEPRLVWVKRSLLEANGFLPDCSPFSERWMSELDNHRSKDELGVRYTPLADYLRKIVDHYTTNPPLQPAGYRRRRSERDFAQS